MLAQLGRPGPTITLTRQSHYREVRLRNSIVSMDTWTLSKKTRISGKSYVFFSLRRRMCTKIRDEKDTNLGIGVYTHLPRRIGGIIIFWTSIYISNRLRIFFTKIAAYRIPGRHVPPLRTAAMRQCATGCHVFLVGVFFLYKKHLPHGRMSGGSTKIL